MATNTAAHSAPALDPMHAEPAGHGNSIAAWSAVGVMLVGTLIGCIGYTLANVAVLVAGLGVIVLGLVVGAVMKAAGFGVGGSKTKSKEH